MLAIIIDSSSYALTNETGERLMLVDSNLIGLFEQDRIALEWVYFGVLLMRYKTFGEWHI